MTISSSNPGAPRSGVDRATAKAAAAVIALSAAIAGVTLASAIAGGSSIEAPAHPERAEMVITTPAHPTGPTITTNGDDERRGGFFDPLHAD